MGLPSLFKTRGNKSYNYTPRYYDERKERLEELKKSKEKRSDDEYFKGYRRKSFRDDWKTVRKSRSNDNSRLRLVVIFIILLMFAIAAIRYINLDSLI
ncbi:hypothetical protein [Galbibacter mesophilus]|uniref:hypothetical protein n=1 Tax=Galbibacter mesophilus TaxID=379069 RepID=UPI00191D08EE|nr:hypothetical protein [Galbibacter mesophilus]MCM5662724.1 hypothetical protein [Galbibacter mesophilus]